MSSMRNAVQRRNHKERSQPQERSKWGLLEKRKDYSLRAKDHNVKKAKLKALRQKASERNEDEFYFGMMRNATIHGKRIAKRGEENGGGGGKVLSQDVVKLMKTQDAAYLRTVLQSTKRARERAAQQVVLLETGASIEYGTGKKILFDQDGEQDTRQDSPLEEFDLGDLEMLGEEQPLDDVDLDASEDEEGVKLSPAERKARKRKRHNLAIAQRRLQVLQSREKSLTTALRELEDQRARMNGTLGAVSKTGKVFKVKGRKR